jgi:hypothetical protein
MLVHYAVDPNQIERVAGFADTMPLPGEKPESESNHRVTISLSMAISGKGRGTTPETAGSGKAAEKPAAAKSDKPRLRF